jgi:hypothetical protein
MPEPQVTPFLAGSAPESKQVGVPVAHDVCPLLQTFTGVQAAPAVQATQFPLLHTPALPHVPTPHATPFLVVSAPMSAHVGVPPAHVTWPLLHGLAAGTQAAPTTQAPHTPLLQTWPVPQAAPFLLVSAPWSTHVGEPPAHEILPTSQELPPGTHAASALQVPQTPPLHTLPVPQIVPSARPPTSTQVAVPLVQEIWPRWHALDGVQAAPVAQEPQTPWLQTAPPPQGVPSARGPVALQVAVPLEQESWPR